MGRREELETGLAGLNNDLYQRMLSEISDIAKYADQNGWHGLGTPNTIFKLKASKRPTI